MPDKPPKPTAVKPPEPAKTQPKDSKPKESSNKPKGRPPALQKQLEEFFMVAGMMVGVNNKFDGEVIRDNAESLAENWAKAAQQNATIKRILEGMMETSTWSAVLMSTASVAIPIMQNHGVIPENVPHPFMQPPKLQKQAKPQGPVQGREGVIHPPQQGSPVTPSNHNPNKDK